MILVLVLVTLVVESAWVILGPPDFGGGLAFFDTGVPTLSAGEATMELIAWAAILLTVAVLLMSLIRTIGRSRLVQQPASRAGILLAVGLMLLIVSVVQHSLSVTSFCCGSSPAAVREAIHLAQ